MRAVKTELYPAEIIGMMALAAFIGGVGTYLLTNKKKKKSNEYITVDDYMKSQNLDLYTPRKKETINNNLKDCNNVSKQQY